MVVLRAKCIIVGNATVGKSALTQVFHSDGSHFPKSYAMTIGVELCVKTVHIPETNDAVELFLYDSAGKETFSDYVHQFWDQPSVTMVVFDVTNPDSFKSCNKWIERVRAAAGQDIPAVLVGNKIDLEGRRNLGSNTAEEYANQKGIRYFECSAKEQENVDAPFYYLANEFYRLYQSKIEIMKTLSE
ncbi:intraflagellar transport protein 27 homolog [Anneissia japonica]|uniref:intraflagellar transport protein 27 homolog n=1 Tax=Anneissia japonica TaxID=1529436 RepID=UPI00142567F9|nr:intraflagellar transport protein 27 homolog [Anneissia japonica]